MPDAFTAISFVFALFGLQAWVSLFRVERRLRELEARLGGPGAGRAG